MLGYLKLASNTTLKTNMCLSPHKRSHIDGFESDFLFNGSCKDLKPNGVGRSLRESILTISKFVRLSYGSIKYSLFVFVVNSQKY